MDIFLDKADLKNPVEFRGRLVAYNNASHQSWKILETADYGEILIIDDEFQSSQSDEHIYHETLVHSLMLGLKSPKRVLILGGAEGCTTREVLAWSSVEHIVQVDWDASLLQYFQTAGHRWNGDVYTNSKIELYCMNALDYLTTYNDMFDVIIIDLLDPNTREESVLLQKIIGLCKEKLSKDGGISINCGSINSEINPHGLYLLNWMKEYFPEPKYNRLALHVNIPSFLGEWGFAMIVPRAWSMQIHSSDLPKGLEYFTLNKLIDSVQWSNEDNFTWKNFWQKTFTESSQEFPKKLTYNIPVDLTNNFGQYGC